MCNANPQANSHLGNDSKDDAQDLPDADQPHRNPQDDSQDNNTPSLIDPQHCQSYTCNFERFFAQGYPLQKPLLLYLNRLDFKNLVLAGVESPLSRRLLMETLIPSKCDEILIIALQGSESCSNTTKTVHEIKACHGLHHDGWGLRGRQDRWIEPKRLLKHVPDSDSAVATTNDNEGGYFDSFNVCLDCHERDRQRRRPYEDWTISTFHTPLCRTHSLHHLQHRPYNLCHCRTFLDQYWRCHVCSLDTLDELRMRADTFGSVQVGNVPDEGGFTYDADRHRYINLTTGEPRQEGTCPILGCASKSWIHAPPERSMMACRACTSIFSFL